MLDRLTIERMAAEAGDPILIALSGGGDSVALLHLLVERVGAGRLRAGIVDHALRAGSDHDAARARAFAADLGVEAVILTLAWGKGASRAQQHARQARYAALCEHARGLGARIVAAAHTGDDQAETVLMRAAAGSGWRGLAGMAPFAPVPLWPEGRGLMLARPLLGARRGALRDLLRSRGAEWIEDPANANPAYERVRVRARLAALAEAGFDAMRLVCASERLRVFAEALDRGATELIAAAARFEDHRIVLDRGSWRGPVEVRRRALSALVAAAAGAPREPPAEAVARLEAKCAKDSFSGASLGGAHIAAAGEAVIIERDRGAAEGRADGVLGVPPLRLWAGVETVWDGRLAVRASATGVTAIAATPLPRFVGEDGAPAAATLRWLLAERAAHALGAHPL